MRDLGDVADDDGRAVVRRDADGANLVERADLPRHAHQVLAAEALDVAGADVDVVALERCREVRQRQAEREQRGGAGRDDVLPLVAADHVDLGNAGHARELRPYDPVHDRVQIRGVVGGAVGAACAGCDAQDEAEDLTETRRDRAELGLESRRQRRPRFLQAFGHALAREVDVGAVREHDGDLRQPVARHGARVVEPR